jgi:hypothetical protein
MYEIVCIVPSYCRFTDALIGTRVAGRSHAYETAELALKIAARKDAKDYEEGGDAVHYVVPAGGCAYGARICGAYATSDTRVGGDEIPF